MQRLPHWKITDFNPAFYDTESLTAIEQTARVYGAMQTMIDEFNNFVDSVNHSIEEFENGMTTDFEEFTVGLRQEFQDFIDVVELRVSDAETFMKTNINKVTADTINTAIRNGSLRIAEEYDEATESYNLLVTGGV